MYRGIGIAGKIASGKTTLAHTISGVWGIPVIPLAKALKDDVTEALSAAGLACAVQDIVPQYKREMRGLLQDWGLLFRKLNGEDYWVKRMLAAAGKKPCIVDDVRFVNEFDSLRKHGFLLVRLEIAAPTQEARLHELYPDTPMSQLQHVSETDLDGHLSMFDIVIDSNTVRNHRTVPAFFKHARRYEFSWAPEPVPVI